MFVESSLVVLQEGFREIARSSPEWLFQLLVGYDCTSIVIGGECVRPVAR
jgi:hypothetical protein